jgi:hypothetical protein
MKRSSEICRKQTMIQEEAHDPKDSLVVRSRKSPGKKMTAMRRRELSRCHQIAALSSMKRDSAKRQVIH